MIFPVVLPVLLYLSVTIFTPSHAKKHQRSTKAAKHDFFAADNSGPIFNSEYFQADEAAVASSGHHHQISQQKCVDIPQNMSLCQGIGYGRMLIPNLMEHETVREANEQSQTWIPLADIRCHQHTRLFLCSLFAPICPMQQPSSSNTVNSGAADSEDLMLADQAALLGGGPVILPCRSLCESVKHGCEGVMAKHGFPWPGHLNCARFPVDNDMCISPNPLIGGGASDVPPTALPTEVVTTRPSSTVRVVTSGGAGRTRRPSAAAVTANRITTPRKTTSPPPATTTTLSTTESAIPELDTTTCSMCPAVAPPSQLDTAYCQADFVAKVRFRRFTRRGIFLVKRPKLLKLTTTPSTGNSGTFNRTWLEEEFRTAKSVELLFAPDDGRTSNTCRLLCAEKVELRSQLYLVMGRFMPMANNNNNNPQRMLSLGSLNSAPVKTGLPQIGIQLLLPWFSGHNSRDFRQAEKRLQHHLKCASSPRLSMDYGSSKSNHNLHATAAGGQRGKMSQQWGKKQKGFY